MMGCVLSGRVLYDDYAFEGISGIAMGLVWRLWDISSGQLLVGEYGVGIYEM
jgi:hypothetical protein